MKIIYKKIINLFFFIIYGKIKIKKKYTKDISLKKISLDSNQFIKLYIIKKCRIYTDCNTNVAYISKNLIIPKISYQQNKNIVSTVKFNSSLKYGTPKLKTYFKGNIFSLLQGSSGSNYWHWLYDIMPKIEIMHKNGYLKRIDFFYVPDVNKFILETLKLYGIKKNQLINSKYLKHIVADQIYAFEHLYIKEGNFVNAFEKVPKWIPFFLNKKFLNLRKKFKCSKKIFIDRSDSKFIHFKIINYKETKKLFKKKGFKFYKLSKLTFLKQVYLFNHADVIVGAHGAGFANLAFCKKKTRIYEFLPKKESYRSGYKKISNYLKLKHHKIITKNEPLFGINVDTKLINNIF